MNALLIYMIKVAAYLAGFYLVYRFLLSRDTMYGRNRSFHSPVGDISTDASFCCNSNHETNQYSGIQQGLV